MAKVKKKSAKKSSKKKKPVMKKTSSKKVVLAKVVLTKSKSAAPAASPTPFYEPNDELGFGHESTDIDGSKIFDTYGDDTW